MAIQCDIRDEQSVKDALKKTVDTFGGLDILINNASAINPVPVEQMETKSFDLIMSINTRGTFVASKHAIPYLRNSKNPHILTISPPLYMATDVSFPFDSDFFIVNQLVRQDGLWVHFGKIRNDSDYSWFVR